MILRSYPDIGDVYYTIQSKNKRISLRITKKNTVEVCVPHVNLLQRAEEFVLEKKTWILKKLSLPKPQPIIFSKNTKEFTPQHSLEIIPSHTSKTSASIENNKVIISLSHIHDIESEGVQKFIAKIREQVLRDEAYTYIPNRVKELSKKHGFTYNSIRILHAKTRWGTCDARNNLIFTCYIMLLPHYLIDFIILHELCHTIHKNHGQQFHTLLANITEQKKQTYERELKQYRIL
ncbi:MAG TPA: DUF45 domain-containing protein [Bacteroidales bacterium]|jgi:hypothetical protein|nr:DUF45 domain-containing protein [Bacteroidales bacterium]